MSSRFQQASSEWLFVPTVSESQGGTGVLPMVAFPTVWGPPLPPCTGFGGRQTFASVLVLPTQLRPQATTSFLSLLIWRLA